MKLYISLNESGDIYWVDSILKQKKTPLEEQILKEQMERESKVERLRRERKMHDTMGLLKYEITQKTREFEAKRASLNEIMAKRYLDLIKGMKDKYNFIFRMMYGEDFYKVTAKENVSDDEWFEKLSKEDQEKYIEEHPKSRFANRAKLVTKTIGKAKASVKAVAKAEHEFFHGEGHVAGSEPRRTMGKWLKDKMKGTLKAVKHEVHEFKDAGKGLQNLFRGKDMSDHQKKAIKTVLIHSAMVLGPMAITGGLSAGLSYALPGIAAGFAEHTLVIAAGRAAIFASEEPSVDELMVKVMEKFAEHIANGDISKDEWTAAFTQAKGKS